MALLKSLEHGAKLALAAVLALLFFRPWRRSRVALLTQAKRVLLVRIDQRVGEVLLTTPLVNALEGREVHLLVHPKMVRVVDGLPGVTRVWPFHKSLASALALRAEHFDAVINCGNWSNVAVTSAITTRAIAGTGLAVGPATAPTSWLMDCAVDPIPAERSELVQRAHLVDALAVPSKPLQMSFRAPRANEAVIAQINALGPRFAVVNPGGRLGVRRVVPSAFAAGCRAMHAAGLTVVVTWGPGEEPLADEVCALAPHAVKAVPTDLDGLAALLKTSVMTLCNNTGPMHLAVAVGSPTLALFTGIEVARWSHPQTNNRSLDVSALLEDPMQLETAVADAVATFWASRT